jgi:hypothetical protein
VAGVGRDRLPKELSAVIGRHFRERRLKTSGAAAEKEETATASPSNAGGFITSSNGNNAGKVSCGGGGGAVLSAVGEPEQDGTLTRPSPVKGEE